MCISYIWRPLSFCTRLSQIGYRLLMARHTYMYELCVSLKLQLCILVDMLNSTDKDLNMIDRPTKNQTFKSSYSRPPAAAAPFG